MHINPKTIRIVGIVATFAGFALEFIADYCKDYCGEIEMDELVSKKVTEEIAKNVKANKV